MSRVKKLVRIKWKKIKEGTIIHYPEVAGFCSRSYPDHPEGCPNIRKCDKRRIPDFETINTIHSFRHFYLVYAEFDFKTYLELKREDWNKRGLKITERRLRNLLHWQSSIVKMIKEYIESIYNINRERFFVFGCGAGYKLSFQKWVGSMEHSWINVFSTMKLNGIKLEIKPENKIFLCNLLCSKKRLKFESDVQQTLVQYITSEVSL